MDGDITTLFAISVFMTYNTTIQIKNINYGIFLREFILGQR